MISSGKIINMKLNRTKCNLHMDGFLKKKYIKRLTFYVCYQTEYQFLCLLSICTVFFNLKTMARCKYDFISQ